MNIARSLGPVLFFAVLAAMAAIPANAQSQARTDQALLAGADGSVRIHAVTRVASPAGIERGVQSCMDLTDIDSWDDLDDADNVIIDVDISSSLKVVGVAWDVGIASVGDSWLSDASVFLSNSDGSADPDAVILAPGFAVEAPGNQEFSSGGVVMLADEGLPEIEPNGDGIVRLQFYEAFDDVADAVDSEWRNAASPVTCPGIWLELDDIQGPGGPGIPPEIDPSAVPVDSPMAMLLLILLLGGAAIRYLPGRS